MKSVKVAALLGAAVFTGAIVTTSSLAAQAGQANPLAGWTAAVPVKTTAQSTVAGWPAYVAMGAVGGPNINPPTLTSTGGDDDFGGKPVDVVFKYAGAFGTGDPGIIDPPTNTTRMTGDLTTLSGLNKHAMRVAIVEYTADMSDGFQTADFTDSAQADPFSHGNYLMARHFITLAADATAMEDGPVVYKNKKFYGTLILNPDMMGAIQQGNDSGAANEALPKNAVNTAVDQALCFLTTSRSYLNTSNPNGLSTAPYLNKTYKGTPVHILEKMLADGYPVWSINSGQDTFWNTATDNLVGGSGTTYSQIGKWFNKCATNPTYDTKKYVRPNFPKGFEGWIQANNWMIRTFSPAGHVTFGYQENMWAVSTSFWLHADLSDSEIETAYSKPVSNWLKANAPSAIRTGALGASFVPDYFVFDRYENDDSAAPGSATLYNARSWDNYLTAVGQVSSKNNNIPTMMWQIPGSHIPYVGEANPETIGANEYVFSSAPVYFFGDSNLKSNLSNIIMGSGSTANTLVGNFAMNCASNAYNCAVNSDYKQYLTAYKTKPNNFNWGKDHAKLAWAAKNAHLFAILWGGGDTTNVIKNFSNPDDHGWLAGKIKAYYKNPTILPHN